MLNLENILKYIRQKLKKHAHFKISSRDEVFTRLFFFFHLRMKFHPCLSCRTEISSRQKRAKTFNHKQGWFHPGTSFILGWNFTCKHPLNYLLPHRPAIREERNKAKIRAVFDASCSTSGPSLNECLYSGEWRVGTYGVEWHCFPIWWFKKVSHL